MYIVYALAVIGGVFAVYWIIYFICALIVYIRWK